MMLFKKNLEYFKHKKGHLEKQELKPQVISLLLENNQVLKEKRNIAQGRGTQFQKIQ